MDELALSFSLTQDSKNYYTILFYIYGSSSGKNLNFSVKSAYRSVFFNFFEKYLVKDKLKLR